MFSVQQRHSNSQSCLQGDTSRSLQKATILPELLHQHSTFRWAQVVGLSLQWAAPLLCISGVLGHVLLNKEGVRFKPTVFLG